MPTLRIEFPPQFYYHEPNSLQVESRSPDAVSVAVTVQFLQIYTHKPAFIWFDGIAQDGLHVTKLSVKAGIGSPYSIFVEEELSDSSTNVVGGIVGPALTTGDWTSVQVLLGRGRIDSTGIMRREVFISLGAALPANVGEVRLGLLGGGWFDDAGNGKRFMSAVRRIEAGEPSFLRNPVGGQKEAGGALTSEWTFTSGYDTWSTDTRGATQVFASTGTLPAGSVAGAVVEGRMERHVDDDGFMDAGGVIS